MSQECLCAWRSEDQVQDCSRLTGPQWAGEIPCVSPLILRSWRDPPPHPPLLYCPCLPPTPLGPTLRGVGLGGQEPSRLPEARWVGETPAVPLLILRSWRVPSPSVCLFSSSILPPSHASRTHEVVGGPREWRTRPRSPAGLPEPEWVGETLGALL